MAIQSHALQAYDWLQLLALGGLAGALGQGVRTIVGLKKLHDATSASSESAYQAIDASRLVVSLAIGFIAGALASIGVLQDFPAVTAEQIFALAAAGYAGADFIEGFVSRVSGAPSLGAGEDAKGVGGGGAARAGDGALNADGTVG